MKAVDYLAGVRLRVVSRVLFPCGVPTDAIFCPDRWGGCFDSIALYPGQLVAVDDRHDLYGTGSKAFTLKIVHGGAGGRMYSQRRERVGRWFRRARCWRGLLASDANWSVAYRDDVGVLFRRESMMESTV